VLDARAVRRLVPLELADVDVPPRPGDSNVALFVRVLSARQDELRVELWERGESHGARTVAGARGSPALTSRRVALAAAELARGLRQRRIQLARQAEKTERRRELRERIERDRTLDGPRALRVGLGATAGEGLALVGPALDAELHVYGATRIDLGAAWSIGLVDWRDAAEAWAVRAGPARRFVLGSRTDLDLGLRAEASVLSFPKSAAVDGSAGQEQSWAARIEGAARFQPRLARALRLSLGVVFGGLLRRPSIDPLAGDSILPGRLYVGTELALVLTPARVR
jgi:hypothetical protein